MRHVDALSGNPVGVGDSGGLGETGDLEMWE